MSDVSKTKLSERVRSGCEAAPWVIEEIKRLEAELAKLRAGQEPVAFYWQDIGYENPNRHGPYFGWPDEAALRNVDGGAVPVPLYTAPQPSAVPGDGWIPVSEQLPESERTVLAFYLNSHGKGRRVRAEYIAAKTKSADDGWDSDEPADYDEHADEYFWPAGWYEVMDNWDDLTHMVIHEGEVTHWMPLPAAPAIAAAHRQAPCLDIPAIRASLLPDLRSDRQAEPAHFTTHSLAIAREV